MLLKRRILLISLILLFYGGLVFGFDNLVIHPELSRASSQLFNQSSSTKLSDQQIIWIMQGSIAEDADPRYLNHYYNPITGKGLDSEFALGLPAKEWAQKQNSATGDYSESAVFFNYRQGNYQRAYQGLGHILHLIQDMAVPAHTRNDSHPEGDPFEAWSAVKGKVSLENINKIVINNLDSAFDGLAIIQIKIFLVRILWLKLISRITCFIMMKLIVKLEFIYLINLIISCIRFFIHKIPTLLFRFIELMVMMHFFPTTGKCSIRKRLLIAPG